MFGINRMNALSEYESVKEEKAAWEDKLNFLYSKTIEREATKEELKLEDEYLKQISECDYKMGCLKDEINVTLGIKTGLSALALAAIAILIAITAKCSADKKENQKVYVNPISMTDSNGVTNYHAPAGFELAFDEEGKPYCYQEKTLVKKNY